MARFLSRLFNIRLDEWPRFSLIYLMYFILIVGSNWGERVVEAGFWSRVGVNFLPLAMMGNAVFSIIAIAVYTAFADRIANDKLLIALLVISLAGIGVGLVFLGAKLDVVAYPLFYLIANVPLLDVFNVHWSTYVNGFYDTRAAKRIIPVLGSGARIAGIVSGLTMRFLNDHLLPGGIIMLWCSALAVMAFVVWFIPRVLRDPRPVAGDLRSPFDWAPSVRNVREGYHYVSQSVFLRWLALGTLALMVLMAFINYQTSEILSGLNTIQDISNFTALLDGLSNLVALPFQLFLLSRMIGRIGLGNATLIYPTLTALTCGALLNTPTQGAAALGYLNRTTLRTMLRNPIDALLYNAVPLRIKARARAFIGGFVVPIGSFLGGLLLFGLKGVTGLPAWFLPVLVVALLGVYGVSIWNVRRQYAQALIVMLEQEDFTFLLSQESSGLTVTDPATLNRLCENLERPDASPEFKVFMAQLISQVGGSNAVPILGQAARMTADPRTRSAIVNIIVASEARSSVARQLYTDFLTDPDGQVRQSAIAGLVQLADWADKQFVAQLVTMTDDPDLNVRVQVLMALVHLGQFYELPQAVQSLDGLLADVAAYRRAQGVRVLGQMGDERATRQLLDYVMDLADEVRLEAVLAIETRSKKQSGSRFEGQRPTLVSALDELVAEKMKDLLHDPIERVRQAALAVLGRSRTRTAHQAMVESLNDSSPSVRVAAVDALVQSGKSVIPLVYPRLDSPDPYVRKMVTMILGRINPKEFGALTGANITGNLLAIYRDLGRIVALTPYVRYSGVAILQSALREQNQLLTEEIFYLLGAIHNPDAVRVVKDSLHNADARVRANAVEALESLTTAQTAHLIAPLFEPALLPMQLLSIGQDTWDMDPPHAAQVIRQLATEPETPWLRTITIFALGQMSVELAEQPKIPAGATEPAGQAKHISVLDEGVGKIDAKTRPKTRRPAPADLWGAVDETVTPKTDPSKIQAEGSEPAPAVLLTLSEIETLLDAMLQDPAAEVRQSAQTARRMLQGETMALFKEAALLSSIEKIIFLKGVPFFQGMTVEQLRVLANVCEEEFFPADKRIYTEGAPGGTLYVVVNGRVGIEQEKRKGSFARLATVEAHSYFGEMNLFDNSPRSTSAIAVQDTLTLRLRREPLIALARQHPDLSLELINVLSQRLRETSDRVADLTRTRPRELHKLFDQFDS